MYSGIPAGGISAGGFVVSSTGPAALAPCAAMHGLPACAPGALTAATTPSHCMTYSGPQAAQVSMNGMVTTSVAMHGLPVYAPSALTTTTTPSHSMTYSGPQTYSAPHVPMNGIVTTSVVGRQSIASQSLTYAAPQAPVPSQSVAAVCKVVVHPAVTVTAEEFARINGTTLTEPLPGTAGIETVGVETNREVVVNDTKAVDKTAKIKKRKSRQAC